MSLLLLFNQGTQTTTGPTVGIGATAPVEYGTATSNADAVLKVTHPEFTGAGFDLSQSASRTASSTPSGSATSGESGGSVGGQIGA